MAVGAGELLENTRLVPALEDALAECGLVVGTSARAGRAGVLSPRQAARKIVEACARGERVGIVFGDERTGLRRRELDRCAETVRIPMVANEPSLNLAQAVMVLLYEVLVEALASSAVPTGGASA